MTRMICKECENDAFDEADDGFYYCQQCGVMAEDIIQTGVDDGDLIGKGGGTRGALYNPINRRKISQPVVTPSQPRQTQDEMRYSQFQSQLASQAGIESKDQVKRAPENYLGKEPTELVDFGAKSLSYEDYYMETRDRYVKAFIMMITYQCEALVQNFNVTPLIIGLVGPIALRFVALSGVYDHGWADNAIRDSELQSGEVKDAKRPKTHKDEPRNLDGKRAVTIWVSVLKKAMPLSSSLAISFLACHKAGSPVLPTDIVRGAMEGKIPYLSCFKKIREEMGETSAACPVKISIMCRPSEVISAQTLEGRAASIAHTIGLPLPPVNFYCIASNYLKRLSIPEEKILDLVHLIHTWSMPPELNLSQDEMRLPTRVCVMSILIVAIRMLYNINGLGVWERSLGLATTASEEVDNETGSAAAAESSDVTKKATRFDTEELLKKLEARYHELAVETLDSEKDLLSYLSLGKNEFFAGLEEDLPDDTYRAVDDLWNGYPKEEEEIDQFRTPSMREDDDLPLNQLLLGESLSMDLDPSSEHRVASSHENHQQEEVFKERAIKRLMEDMEDNSFHYIPPRVKVKRPDYLHYVRKREDGGLIYAAHGDYYILLRVCAKVAEVDVRNMHRGVLSFEKRLALIEKKIDQCLDGENVGEEQSPTNNTSI